MIGDLSKSSENASGDEFNYAPVQIGFALIWDEIPEDSRPITDSFVSDSNQLEGDYLNRIGGKPVWLNPLHALNSSQLTCEECQSPYALLLQLYTPEDDPQEAFHRLLHVFMCKNGACHKKSRSLGFKVFRSQFAEDNSVYDSETGMIKVDASKVEFCQVCGASSQFKCGSCIKARYCSKSHQIWHWKHGHKEYCSAKGKSALEDSSTWTYPMNPVESEPEPEKQVSNRTPESVPQSLPNITAAEDPTFDDTYEDSSAVGVDKAFLKFEKRISRAPRQILRYNRVSARDDPSECNQEPLYISNEPTLSSSDIPLCPHCQSPRTFEFQIMPQVLNHLRLNNEDPNEVDFGTILVFSCDANCHIGDGIPVQEFWWRQDPTGHGFQDLAKQHQLKTIENNLPDV